MNDILNDNLEEKIKVPGNFVLNFDPYIKNPKTLAQLENTAMELDVPIFMIKEMAETTL